MKSLIADLIKFQSSVPVIPKNCINPFFSQGGKKAMYADLATVIDTCKPVLNKNNLSVVQAMKIVDNRNTLSTKLIHVSGESIESDIYLPDIVDPQKLTAAITYLRRSTYISILGLVADDDDDGNSVGHEPKKQVYQPKEPIGDVGDKKELLASDKQQKAIYAIAKSKGVTPNKVTTLKEANDEIKRLNSL